MNRFWSLELATEFYNAVTGFNLENDDLRIAAERSWNLLKVLNSKEGFNRKNDKFPSEWFKPLKFGQSTLEFKDFFGATVITPEIANQLLDNYYDERGWNKKDGLPTKEKVYQLGLDQFL
jgi:aldehyde:ferredoxin oxidoreductase